MPDLELYRRHTPDCRYTEKRHTKCNCPIWCQGVLCGEPVRESLGTRDWQRALKLRDARENPDAPRVKPIADAITAFESEIAKLESSTQRKYKNVLRKLREHCKSAGLVDMDELTVEHLDSYRAGRSLSPITATKELQTLRQFLSFCVERDWIRKNPAKQIKAPRNIKPAEVVPYEAAEVVKIIAACDEIGRGAYERLRARAMVLLLRYTALRVSDVATLARDAIRDGQILVRTLKTGQPVFLPIPQELENALAILPNPRGAGNAPRYFFWNGSTSRRAVVGIAERTLAAVFEKSKVPNAHAHRFRHTLATDLLATGATEQDVADILGNSPAIVRKHYAKWSAARQERITSLMSLYQKCTKNPVSGVFGISGTLQNQ